MLTSTEKKVAGWKMSLLVKSTGWDGQAKELSDSRKNGSGVWKVLMKSRLGVAGHHQSVPMRWGVDLLGTANPLFAAIVG